MCAFFLIGVYVAARVFSEADGSIQNVRRLGKY